MKSRQPLIPTFVLRWLNLTHFFRGAEPWTVDLPVKSVMVVGYDAWAKNTTSNFKVGALVCTLNDTQSKFISFAIKHRDMEELSSRIRGLLERALAAYKKENGSYPERLIFYRDAVGEGQIPNLFMVLVFATC